MKKKLRKYKKKFKIRVGWLSHSKLIKEDKECFFDNFSSTSPFEKKYKLFSVTRRTKMKFENEILSTMKNDVKAAKQSHEEKMNLLRTIFLNANSTHSFKDLLSTLLIFSDN
jgi:hypothetical protein